MSTTLLEPPPATLRTVSRPQRTPLQRLRRYTVLGTRLVWRHAGELFVLLRSHWLRLLAGDKLRRSSHVCLGSGNAPIPGWTNVDLDGCPDVRLDLCQPLPVGDGALTRIYSEHLIEHLSCEAGLALLRECRRALAPHGVLRIATPDLDALVTAYREDFQDQDWMRWPGHEWIDTPARMLNQAMRGWGHQHLYDEHELTHRLRLAGFDDIRRCELSRSEHHDLCDLETRPDSKLILEARVRGRATP